MEPIKTPYEYEEPLRKKRKACENNCENFCHCELSKKQ